MGKQRPFPIWLGVLLAAAILVAGILIFRQPNLASAQQLPSEVSVALAAQVSSQGAFNLDGRKQSEWNPFHIPGVVLIPLDQLAFRVQELDASQSAAALLGQKGFPKVYNLYNGTGGWEMAGLAME